VRDTRCNESNGLLGSSFSSAECPESKQSNGTSASHITVIFRYKLGGDLEGLLQVFIFTALQAWSLSAS